MSLFFQIKQRMQKVTQFIIDNPGKGSVAGLTDTPNMIQIVVIVTSKSLLSGKQSEQVDRQKKSIITNRMSKQSQTEGQSRNWWLGYTKQ